jgi:branched-chain amino acid transport system substrate-binding protein
LVFLAIGALLLVVAAACGGDEEEKGTPTATRPAATATRTAVATAKPTTKPTTKPTAAATATPTAAPTTKPTTAPTTEPTTAPTTEPSPPAAMKVENIKGITDDKILLGSHFAQTGTYGAAFAPVMAGVQAYFKYVNAELGGIEACGGRDIEIKVIDDAYDPANSPAAVRELVEQDEVFAIAFGLGTAAHSAVWDYLNEKGIPDLWIMSGAHKWGADPAAHPWSVSILPDYYVEGTIFGKYISANMPGAKVGVLYQNDDYGKDELAGVKNGLDPATNEVVSAQSFEATAVDIRSQVTKLKNDGVQAVVGACIPGHCAQAIRAAHDMNWDVQFFIGYVNSDPAMFAYAGGADVMEGVMTDQGNKMYDWTDDPAIAEHLRIMREYGTMSPGNFTVEGQLAAETMIEALTRACNNGDLTRQGLMDAVNSFVEVKSDIGLPGLSFTFSPTDHYAVESMRMLVATVTPEGKGKYEYVGDLISFR